MGSPYTLELSGAEITLAGKDKGKYLYNEKMPFLLEEWFGATDFSTWIENEDGINKLYDSLEESGMTVRTIYIYVNGNLAFGFYGDRSGHDWISGKRYKNGT